MRHDAGETPEVLGGEPPTLSPERLSPVSADSDAAGRGWSVCALVEQCRWEIQAYRRGEPSNEAYGLELLRRALVQGDQDAWAGREQRLAYLLYHCNLKPREIVRFCQEEWPDVQEIYRLRRNILERLLRKTDQLRRQFNLQEQV